MLNLSLGVGELIFRASCVYAFLFLLLRLGGKRHIGEMAPFDLVVLLVLSETVQASLLGDDRSLIGGLISATVLVVISHVVGYLSWRSKKAERFFEGIPKVLVRNGRVSKEIMDQEKITQSELMEALRREGCSSLGKVRFALLENDGTITVGVRRSPN